MVYTNIISEVVLFVHAELDLVMTCIYFIIYGLSDRECDEQAQYSSDRSSVYTSTLW